MALPAYTGTLMPAHRQLITAIGDQWVATVLSTAPVDRTAAAAAVRRLYDVHKLPQPRLIVWMDSPLGCIYAAAVIGQLRDQLRGQLLDQFRRHQLRDQLGGQLWAKLAGQIRGQFAGRLGDQLRTPLRDQLEDQLSDQLQDQLCGQLWGQLRGQIRGRLHGQLWDQLQGRLWDDLWDQFGGQLRIQLGDQFSGLDRDDEEAREWDEPLYSVFPWNDAYALAFYGCAMPIAGRLADPRLGTLSSVVAETGWLIPMRGAVVVGARPAVLHRDARGDLHNPAGMALAYPDGWGLYAWHGRRVPAWVIVAPSTEAITAEENVEIRRCAIESLGWDRFIAEAGLVPIAAGHSGDSRDLATARVPDPGNPGQHLVLYEVPERLWGRRIRLLMCTNGTPERDGTRRRYGLTVPPHISDPVEAAAWTAGLGKNEYAQMVRRT